MVHTALRLGSSKGCRGRATVAFGGSPTMRLARCQLVSSRRQQDPERTQALPALPPVAAAEAPAVALLPPRARHPDTARAGRTHPTAGDPDPLAAPAIPIAVGPDVS